MTTAKALIDEARSMLGVKHRHMGDTKEFGVDCVGLVIAAGVATGCIDPSIEKPTYGRVPGGGTLQRHILTYADRYWTRNGTLAPLEEAQHGDLAIIAWREVPMHVALITTDRGRPMFLHSYADIGHVVEHGITPIWHSRIAGLYRLKGLS